MIRSTEGGSSAGPFTTPTEIVVASSLSIGSGLIVSFSWWAHLITSALFQARALGPVSGRLSATIGWKGLIILSAVSCWLSAAGVGFLVILFPPGSWAFLTVGLPDPQI